MKNIMFIAPPAAGKGTQAVMFKEKYKIPHISTGDILREISKEDSEIGHYVAETLASGDLVKDEITYKLIERRLKQDDCKEGFIIDGFPRTLNQAIEFDKILSDIGYELKNVFLIDIKKETLEKRIVGRRICEDCGSIFNINSTEAKPKQDSICDNCSGKLYQRSDDNLESFNNRFQKYLEKTTPIIDYYKSKNILYEVDGNKDSDDLFKQIDEILNKNS